MEAIAAVVAQVARDLRVADAIDIALVALAIFALLNWLRQGASPLAARRAFVVSTLLVIGYIVTRTFELLLVRRLVEALAVVAVVAMVVVFQHELRRFLNRLGSWRPLRFQSAVPASAVVDDMVEAIAHLAERRIGALIALKGREPWDEHIQGGIDLDGRLSQPLLFSLFDPDTPGHDGAVLVEGGRISRFAVHLPMPRHLPEASRYGGTRHAAAAGLTERCDALVIVVSEERGTISLAHDGEVEELGGIGELSTQVDGFWRHSRTVMKKPWSPQPLLAGAASLALATLAWFVFAYSPNSIVRTADVPVDVRNMPDTWILERVEPVEVALALSGPERAFESLDEDALAVSIDFDRLEEGANRMTIDASNVELPGRLQLRSAEPGTVQIVARQLLEVEVPIEVPLLGSLDDDLALVDVQPQPARLTLLVRADQAPPQRVLTEPIDLRSIENSQQAARALSLPNSVRLASDQPTEVTVRIEVQARN